MTSFALKIIAILTMIIDHTSYMIFNGASYFNIIGRIAFPIFAYQITEGYIHTSNIKKYLLRLLLFALLSQIPFTLFVQKYITENAGLNIFFTLSLGLISIIIYNFFSTLQNQNFLNYKILKIPVKKIIGLFLALTICIVAELLNVDYGAWGVLIILSFYVLKNSKIATSISFILLCVLKYGQWIILYGFNYYYLLLCIGTIFPILFICLYTGKQGPKIKYFLYAFYPLHLLLLYFI